ncbi:MAG: NAD-dependent epimerase/dehydratase family protein [Betaproteobacteria bacterium]|nr:NAD-dependent epimerase/dehydratase family protein [Betaproteobacteria bacterium]
MRILVTGADGFVAATLVPLLAASGHQARAAGRALTGEIDGATDWRALLAGCEAVVHLANLAHRARDARAIERANVAGTRRLAEQAAACGLRRLVYLSSVKALGEETPDRPFDAASVPAPGSVYGRAKLAAERALARVAADTALEVVTLRPPLVYGANAKANFRALARAVARGWPLPLASVRNRRSLVYVGNLADAIVRVLEAPRAAGRTYLVADGAAVSTPELCRALGAALGRPARLLAFPPRLLDALPPLRALTRSLEVDDRALRDELGWRPPFSFEEGLRASAQRRRGAA